MAVFESPAKRPRWDPSVYPAPSTIAEDRTFTPGAGGSGERKSKPCLKFFSVSGCPYGDTCHYLHFHPGGLAALGIPKPQHPVALASPMSAGASALAGTRPPPGSSSGGGGYKTKLCNRFASDGGCRFTDKCHFAHGEAELRANQPTVGYQSSPSPRGQLQSQAQPPYYQNGGRSVPLTAAGLPPAGGPIVQQTVYIATGMVGAVIGKAGANVKEISRVTGAKVTVQLNPSDPETQIVTIDGPSQHIEQAVQMIQGYVAQREAGQVAGPPGGKSNSTMGAHNYKTKICDKFIQGLCTFGERCHFAHGASDLRAPGDALAR